MLLVTHRLLKINNQFGVESSSNLFLAQIILTKHRRFVALVGCEEKARAGVNVAMVSCVADPHESEASVPLINVENQTGM